MKHMLHIFVVAFAATLGTLFLGIGAEFTSLLYGLIFTAVATGIVVPFGVLSIVKARSILGLAQIGMLLQIVYFWALMWLAISLAPAWMLAVTSGWVTSAVILVVTIGLGMWTRAFQSSFRRSWLPIVAKKKRQ